MLPVLASAAVFSCSARAPSAEDSGATPDAGWLALVDSGPESTCDNLLRCSQDLHDVIDCRDAVTTTCPPDQGCEAGRCVPACESARANQSTFGCEFYTFMIDDLGTYGGCFAAYVVNTWNAPITISVDRDDTTLNVSDFARIPSGTGRALTYAPLPGGQLPPGQIAILFLEHNPRNPTAHCPVPAAVERVALEPMGLQGTARGKAFRITTSAPAVVFDVFPYGGGATAHTSASLLLPSSAWHTNYIAVLPWDTTYWDPTIAFIAREDGTEVTIVPRDGISPGTGVAGATRGVPTTYAMSHGEVLQLQGVHGGLVNGIAGSAIRSNKAIALWGASPALVVEYGAPDAAHQQIPPVRALGHEYAAVRYRNRVEGREESVPWRLVGVIDGTELTYEGLPAGAGPPTTLSAGQVATFHSLQPFLVRSQDAEHPFYMSAHMTGSLDPQLEGSRTNNYPGDPEFVNVIATDQYLNRYVFFADPTYPETNLVVVRKVDARGAFQNVVLDCAGALTGWQPLGASRHYEYTRIDLSRHNFEPQGGCDNGRHEITSAAPFAATVWGWGSLETGFTESGGFYSMGVSYAFPAGMGLKPVTTAIAGPF